MLTTRDAFLSQFDSAIRPWVVEFGKRISDMRADVLVIMARKAACFVECLRTLHLADVGGVITSDRVLDMDMDWLRAKTVAVVDDAVISGTTLSRTIDRLRNAGALGVESHAFCVDRDSWCPDLVRPVRPYLELDDRNTTSVCASIVDAMSLVPQPYAIDYPLLIGLRIPATALDDVHTSAGWTVDDVSSPLQRENGAFSLTVTPSSAVLAAFNESVGWPISRHAMLKVRLYGRLSEAEREVCWCRVLPIVAVNPLMREEVDGLFSALLASESGNTERLAPIFTSGVGK